VLYSQHAVHYNNDRGYLVMMDIVRGVIISERREELKSVTIGTQKLKKRLELLKSISTNSELQNIFEEYKKMETQEEIVNE
jgi:hypothetical protein